MTNIIDSDVSSYGIPIHNPPYWGKQAFWSFDAVNLVAKASRPDVIAALVPRPLVPLDDTIHITACKVREFRFDMPSHLKDLAWDEIEVQVPVSFKNRYYLYWCEVFVNHFGMMIPSRELLGFPKKMVVGEGKLQILEGAPQYLLEAKIQRVEKAMYLQIDITVDGGCIVYDYNNPEKDNE